MSTRFTVYCKTCEVPGPHIRRHHSGAFLLAADTARFFPDAVASEASDDWGAFLIEHEYCELELGREWRRPEIKEQRKPDMTLDEFAGAP